MPQKFEVPAFDDADDKKEAKEDKEAPKGNSVNLNPTEDTVKEHEGFQEKINNLREQEAKDQAKSMFVARVEGYKNDYKNYSLAIGENEFTMSYQNIEVNGQPVKNEQLGGLKKSVAEGKVQMEQITANLSVKEAKSGIDISYNVPAAMLAYPEKIQARLKNDFSGGTYERAKGEGEKAKQEAALPPAKANEPQKAGPDKEKTRQQVDSLKKAAVEKGGEVSVMQSRESVTVNIHFQDRQVRLTTTGAVWSATETRDSGKTVNSKGSSPEPMDLLSDSHDKKSE